MNHSPFSQFSGFTPIDRHFADFVLQLDGNADEHVWLAAALASNATQTGNICLDLQAIAGKPVVKQESQTSESISAPQLSDWVTALRESRVVGEPGDIRPLVLDDKGRLYLYRYWRYERSVADALRMFAASDFCPVDTAILRADLARLFPPQQSGEPDWQRLAAVTAVLRRFSVVTGGPGTGKTSTVLRILMLLLSQPRQERLRIALTAPTGKAAARLKEAVTQSKQTVGGNRELLTRIPEEASTLHRFLGLMSGLKRFRYDRNNPLPFDMIVVDEASMVDLPLMAKLLDAIPHDARLLLLGDRDQLASVEPGAVFGDICNVAEAVGWSPPFRERIKPFELTLPDSSSIGNVLRDSITVLRKSYRFGPESGIGHLSRSIQSGDHDSCMRVLTEKHYPDVSWQETAGSSIPAKRLERWVLEAYGGYLQTAAVPEALSLFARSRILCAVRQGPFGVVSVNEQVEETLLRKGLVRGRGNWYKGRPVLISRNDYGLRLFNGDIGIAWEEPPRGSATAPLVVAFLLEGGEIRRIVPSRLPEHETVYAMTVHKAQGSEFDHVLLILPESFSPVLTRELLYTGITRARKRLEIWARRETIEAGIDRRVTRDSGLRAGLRQD